MRRWFRRAGALVALALIAYFAWFSYQSLDGRALASALSSPRAWVAMLAAALAHMAVYPLTGSAWRRLLLRQGQDWSAGQLARLVSLTQLAKYVPGNVLQHASRAALALRAGMPVKPYAATVVQETLLACAASILVGVPLFAGANAAMPAGYGPLLWGLFAGGVLLILLLCVDVRADAAALPGGRLGRLLGVVGGLPGPRVTLAALLRYALNYLLIGAGLWLIARALGMAEGVGFALAASAFALSWILGFLAPGAPAGIGAREGIMILILQGHAADAQVAQFVLLARLASMAADLISFCLAAWWPRPAGSRI